MRLTRIATMSATVLSFLVLAQPVSANAVAANSGFYDNQVIEYQATAEVTSSPHAAHLISKGNIVFHIVDANGNVPTVQCARLLAALPNLLKLGTLFSSSGAFAPGGMGSLIALAPIWVWTIAVGVIMIRRPSRRPESPAAA